MVNPVAIRNSALALRRAIAATVLVAAVVPAPARSESDTTTGRINAQIAAPLGVGATSDMSFSRLGRPASPGDSQTTASDRMTSSGLALLQMDDSSPAKIVISGSPNQAVGLVVGDKGATGLNNRKISISGYTHTAGPMPALGPDGRATIEFGATLNLAANIRDGKYRGTFDVIVSNN